MGAAFFRSLFCCGESQEIPIVSSDSPPRRPRPKPPQYRRPPPPHPRRQAQNSQIGPILGRPYVDVNSIYTLEKELGRGQSGVTYLCIEKATKRQYACKSISRSKLVKREEIEDVRTEISILQYLTGQPNIVEFKGAYEDRQNVHLVMELCTGGELFDRMIQKGSYSESEAAAISRQIVTVVHVCHFMGVMHRDLKPENFLLANKDEKSPIKATDFGLSIFIEEG